MVIEMTMQMKKIVTITMNREKSLDSDQMNNVWPEFRCSRKDKANIYIFVKDHQTGLFMALE